jgi:glyoxylase-like metal-dependent hydrolase (beta-lactamase superfamily II)
VEAVEMIRPVHTDKIMEKYPIDENGMMKLGLNALMVNESGRNILIDPGCADFLPKSISEKYGLKIDVPIEERLIKLGVPPEEVTDVIFTHLHFDHGSGAFRRIPGKVEKKFINARYHVLKEHYDYALKPKRKEAGTFFTRFFRYIDKVYWLEDWQLGWIEFQPYFGHTHGMVVPRILSQEVPVYYLTDLVPMEMFLEPGIYSGYDLQPDTALNEKVRFIDGLSGTSRFIYFHEPLKESSIYQ